MLKFTEHGPLHTDQVIRNLDALTKPLQDSNKPLTQEEIFVLLSAACLHDIGMQLIDDPEARPRHAEYAYELIVNSSAEIKRGSRHVKLSISDETSKIAIAQIAKAHWTEHALRLDDEDWIDSKNTRGRLKLLGLLLATADLLDLSPVRARYFRTIHRLYDLTPESELHQKMHQHVAGMLITQPRTDLPGELQFQVDWKSDYPLVREVNDWVMHWFDSQWRQLYGELYRTSRGAIGWAQPWRTVSYREPKMGVLSLSPEAHNILKAERAEQIRIDRNAFTSGFIETLKNKDAVVFVAPSESDFEWRILSDWSKAYARLHTGCRVLLHDGRSNYRFRAENVAANFLKQLGHTMSTSQNALETLTELLAREDGLGLVTIIRIDRPVSTSMHNLLTTLVRRNRSSARICLLICPKAKGPEEVGDATIVSFDSLSLPRKEIEEHLQKRGYSSDTITEMYDEMDELELISHPTHVYRYINLRCNHHSPTRP